MDCGKNNDAVGQPLPQLSSAPGRELPPLRITREPVIWLVDNDADSQNKRNRTYEILRKHGDDALADRMERRWECKVESLRNWAEGERSRMRLEKLQLDGQGEQGQIN